MISVIDALNKLLGDPNDRELKRLWPQVHVVRKRAESEEIQALQLSDLPKKTAELKMKIEDGATTDDLLVDAFAVVIRACELIKGKSVELGKQKFEWDMVPYDVQILGGIVLHQGNITEMKTGEGKTLVCTMPVYLNALTGKGVHVVTVNDYLAKRDAIWMGMLYEALGLTVGSVLHETTNDGRKEAYACDVTYGTNNEFGFDYLRDNMASSLERQVQRKLHYSIVDEVDSILVDEARTPLIISQPADECMTDKYKQYSIWVKDLKENTHYNKDEKQRTAALTEEGVRYLEQLMGVKNIYTDKGFQEVHHIEQALRAHAIYQLDVDYVIKDGEIIIVDEFTGRLMPGRRYGHGLHQAIEAKEGVSVQRESKTLATITFQNYFRLYDKLAGMTGTAKTEAEEFETIYSLRTIVVPTNKPLIRDDRTDAIYRTVEAKFKAVAKIAEEKHKKGQPVLIGTTSIEKSEALAALLEHEKIPYQILNAKHHEKEAEIVANAGQKSSITIATNMAGRGTDIKLMEEVKGLGGLCILGTERHEARRIDNQLRGRAGRQGDAGESQFFVSMEDDLMRLFGGERLKTMMEKLRVPDDVPLENNMVARSIESAQKKVEGRNFDVRRHVVQYDDVMNKHREIIYTRRQGILERIAESEEVNGDSKEEAAGVQPLHEDIIRALRDEADSMVESHALGEDPETWDLKEIHEILSAFHPQLGQVLSLEQLESFNDREKIRMALQELLVSYYQAKCGQEDPVTIMQAERVVTLRSIDTHWMDHIDDMSHLREQVAFSGYAQRDPLIEYKDQGFRRFRQLMVAIDSSIVRTLLQIDLSQFAPRELLEQAQQEVSNLQTNVEEIEGELTQTGVGKNGETQRQNPAVMQQPGQPAGAPTRAPQQAQRTVPKVGRNDLCPCGSGKKYKKCHGL